MQLRSDIGISGLTFPPASFLESATRISLPEVGRLHLVGNVPDWTDTEMERLYKNIFSSSILLRATGQTHAIRTYINRVAGEITSVFLFKAENRRIRVLNELIPLHPNEIRDFAAHIFTMMPETRSITFNAIQTGALDMPYPYQRYNLTEDMIIELPPTVKQYHDRLSKNMRKTIRRYSGRIAEDFPSFEYIIVNGKDVRDEHILKLVEFNRARMSGKNKVSGVDEAETKWFLDCVRHFDGMVVLAVADGKICAGLASCRAGDHFFLLIVGHDPAWNDYSLGTLCYYRAICEAIERGGKACHFLWGREDHKYRLLGVRHDFDKIVVYPSHVGMIREARHAASLLTKAKMRQARLWLLDPANQEKPLAKLANRLKRVGHRESSSAAASAST